MKTYWVEVLKPLDVLQNFDARLLGLHDNVSLLTCRLEIKTNDPDVLLNPNQLIGFTLPKSIFYKDCIYLGVRPFKHILDSIYECTVTRVTSGIVPNHIGASNVFSV